MFANIEKVAVKFRRNLLQIMELDRFDEINAGVFSVAKKMLQKHGLLVQGPFSRSKVGFFQLELEPFSNDSIIASIQNFGQVFPGLEVVAIFLNFSDDQRVLLLGELSCLEIQN